MKDWSDLEERYQDMRAEDATSAEDFKKAMTERFQKTVQVGDWRATLGLSPLAGVLWAEIVNQVAPAGLTALLSLLMFDFPDDRL